MKTSSALYKESLALLKTCWKKLLGLALIMGILSLAFNQGISFLMDYVNKGSFETASLGMMALLLLLLSVKAVFSTLVSLFSTVAPVHAMSRYDAGGNDSLAAVLGASLKKILPYVWVGILSTLVVIPGLFLFVIPGLYLALVLSLTMYANVLDGKKGLQALAYSVSLFKNRFWDIVGRQLMAGLYGVIPGIALVGAGGLTVLAYVELGPVWGSAAGVILGIPALAYAVRTFLALNIYSYKLYRDVVATSAHDDSGIVVPKWLKAAPWVGLVLGFIALVGVGFFAFLDARKDAAKVESGRAAAQVSGIDAISATSSQQEMIRQAVQYVKDNTVIPQKVDEVTTLTGIKEAVGAIHYDYLLNDVNESLLSDSVLKGLLAPSLCQNTDTRRILDKGILMEYSYKVQNSTSTYSVSLGKADCL